MTTPVVRTIEERGLWRLTYEDTFGPVTDHTPETLTLEAFGERVVLRRDGEGTVTIETPPAKRRTAKVIDMEGIASRALEGTGHTLEGVRSPARFCGVVAARARVVVALRRAGASYPQIGEFLRRSHGAVMVLCKKHYTPERSSEKVKPEALPPYPPWIPATPSPPIEAA